MKKLMSVLMLLGVCNLGFSQMTKSDVEAVLAGVDVPSKETIFVVFNKTYSGGTWVEKYDKLGSKTIKFIPQEGSLLLKGSSYSYLLPYSSIKFIDVEATYIKVEMLN